jgi:putative toxin-antitoxin system antitoxin component (TIGR02293 family)
VAALSKKPDEAKARAARRKRSGDKVAYARVGFKAAEKTRKQVGLEPQAMAAFLGVSEKTYGRRAEEGVLKAAESLKLEMLERVMQTALEVFPDEATARRWLHTPVVALGNVTPLEALTNIRGYERVRNTLYQLAHGVF